MFPEWIEIRNKIVADKFDLSGRDLSEAKLMRADLSEAHLSGTDLTKAYLICANLKGADLREANLTGAVLSEANLSGADLTDAELEDAYLCGTDLRGAINLTCDQIELAFIDRDTIFPDYIQVSWDSQGYYECRECSPREKV
ncbi:MAG: pentapeptide repeat-containing protein [Nitrospinaceae bacterium]|nr:pentapeptide repeat-containing protein [Nitrospinaceae bacterium]NIR57125.1 pentapeptide repeat-containing protein [Nitrospinaceae bacterium]NIS87566.1 pentapeptide repeat-containing protein [Nitrospinaceae bacterium]NIT84436.1 pentapeptide repeat-containing protein [Nitrospinaceae bacterium]NIU46623.1 pentapeptide repeat-containing protein [Nitrospinaceae bacterium]